MFSLPVIESFIVYSGLLICIPYLCYTANQVYYINNKKTIGYLGIIILIALTFSIIFGARYNVGIDQLSYKRIFEAIQSGSKTDDIIEPGFYMICKILGVGGLHSFFFFFSFCLIQVSFILNAFYDKPKLLPYIFIILLSTQFMVMMNLMRQMTFVCCFIWIVAKRENFNFIKYLITICLCTLILHKSSILAIFLYPIIKTDKNLCTFKNTQIIIYITCIYLGYSHFILDKFEDFSQIASLLGYSQYEGFNVFEALFMDPNWGPRTLFRFALVLVAIVLSNKTKRYLKDDNLFTPFYNLFFWGCCAEVILYGTNVIARVFLPMYYMKLVIFAFTLLYIANNWKKNYYNLLLGGLFIGLLLMDFSSLFFEAMQPDNSSAFRFFWQQ